MPQMTQIGTAPVLRRKTVEIRGVCGIRDPLLPSPTTRGNDPPHPAVGVMFTSGGAA